MKRIDFCYTPKHGSWLNVAECELSCLTSQCLSDRRIGELPVLQSEIGIWSEKTNAKQRGVDWQFRIENARMKLKRLYPKIKTGGRTRAFGGFAGREHVMWTSVGVLVFAAAILLFDVIFWITGRNEPADMRFVLAAVGILGLFAGWRFGKTPEESSHLRKPWRSADEPAEPGAAAD